jgi:hypothetical protein
MLKKAKTPCEEKEPPIREKKRDNVSPPQCWVFYNDDRSLKFNVEDDKISLNNVPPLRKKQNHECMQEFFPILNERWEKIDGMRCL